MSEPTHDPKSCLATIAFVEYEIEHHFARHVAECHEPVRDSTCRYCGGDGTKENPYKFACAAYPHGRGYESNATAPVQASGAGSSPAWHAAQDALWKFDGAWLDHKFKNSKESSDALCDARSDLLAKIREQDGHLARIERERDEARAALEKAREIDVEALARALPPKQPPHTMFTETGRFELARMIAVAYHTEITRKIPAAAADVHPVLEGHDEPGGGVCETCGRFCHQGYGKLKGWAGRPACDDCRCSACRGAR